MYVSSVANLRNMKECLIHSFFEYLDHGGLLARDEGLHEGSGSYHASLPRSIEGEEVSPEDNRQRCRYTDSAPADTPRALLRHHCRPVPIAH